MSDPDTNSENTQPSAISEFFSGMRSLTSAFNGWAKQIEEQSATNLIITRKKAEVSNRIKLALLEEELNKQLADAGLTNETDT